MDPIPVAKPIIGAEERAAVDRVLRSGLVAQGPEVAAFEQDFSRQVVNGRRCVAVSSGTAGLHLGLLTAGVGPGDEVVVPSFTFAATANAVALTGAVPVFADISADTFCLDADSVEAVLTERTVAVMPVHLYGHPADMTSITEVAVRRGLRVFEDAAQAHGASWQGRAVGTFGDFGVFSFYPTKNMTSGEGGMVTCRTQELAGRLRLLRNQGMAAQYENEVVGFNARMTDLHAALGRVQLSRLGDWTERRRANAAFLTSNLRGVVVPVELPGAKHVYHQYTVRVPSDDRDRIVKALREEHAVGSRVYYPTPAHRLPSFSRSTDLPETERAAAEVISLPVHPSLSEADLTRVVNGVNAVVRAGA